MSKPSAPPGAPSVSAAPRKTSPWAVAGVVGVALVLGCGHVLARWAFANGVNVVTAAAARSATAAVLLFVFLLARGERPIPLPPAFKWTIPIGLCIAVQTFSIQTAVSVMPVAVALLVMYAFPFLTGVASALLGEIRFGWRLGGALTVAMLGLALVVGVSATPPPVLGVALAFLAAVAFTGALVLTPRLAPSLTAPMRTFCTMLVAGTIFVVYALASGQFHWPESSAGVIGLAGLSICYAIGISALFLLLPSVGAVPLAVTLNLEPIVVSLAAWLALGEAFTFTQSVGALIVVGAVMFYQATQSRR